MTPTEIESVVNLRRLLRDTKQALYRTLSSHRLSEPSEAAAAAAAAMTPAASNIMAARPPSMPRRRRHKADTESHGFRRLAALRAAFVQGAILRLLYSASTLDY